MKSIGLGLLGAGELGEGIVALLHRNRDAIAQKLGARLDLVALCCPGTPASELPEYCTLVDDPYEVVEDSRITLLVDAGFAEDSLDLNLRSLDRGKELITANLDLLAQHGTEILQRAHECQQMVAYSGALGDLAAISRIIAERSFFGEVKRIACIENGERNQKLLAGPQQLQVACSSGQWAKRVALLASSVGGWGVDGWVSHGEVVTRAAEVDLQEYNFAEKSHQMLLETGVIERRLDGLAISIETMLVPDTAPFTCAKRGYGCGIVEFSDGHEQITQSRLTPETVAQEVLLDLLDVASRVLLEPTGCVPSWRFVLTPESQRSVLVADQQMTPCYIRFDVVQEPGVIARLAGMLGEHGVPIEHMESPAPVGSGVRTRSVVITTAPALWRNVRLALEKIDRMPATKKPARILRVLTKN